MSDEQSSAVAMLYLLQCGECFKIGYTVNLQARLATLQTGAPFPLTVVYTWINQTAKELERYFHKKFSTLRTQGEWFRLSEADIEYIKSVKEVPASAKRQPKTHLQRTVTPPLPGSLQDLLREHGITSIQDFGHRVRLSKQHAWRLWHGKDRLGLRMAHRIAQGTNIPLAEVIAVEEASIPPDDSVSPP